MAQLPATANSNGSTKLSARELQVLELTSLGLRNVEIAERLGLSVHSIKFHLAAVYRKLGVSNRTEAVVAYMRSELPAHVDEANA